ncbi:MAG: ABC transporter substrate-binding protein [Burkholderiaceae bacterium]
MVLMSGRRYALAMTLCLSAAILCSPTPGAAVEADPAATRIRSFYDVLLDAMKTAQRTPVRARYEKLEPAVRATFDLAAMTRIAVGPTWTSIPGDEQKALQEQFARLTIATYANRFDGYSGERFEVEPATETRGENRIVHSALLKSQGGSVALNYLVHPIGGDWKAIDVYLSGTISELATRRSEFGALLRAGGPRALIDSLRQRADKLLQPG